MQKIRKKHHFKPVLLALLICFAVNSAVYGIDLSEKSNLRPNVLNNTRNGRSRIQRSLNLATIKGVQFIDVNSYIDSLPPRLRPKSRPNFIVQVESSSGLYKFLLPLYIDPRNIKHAIFSGPLDYYASSTPLRYERNKKRYHSWAPLFAQSEYYAHQGVSLFYGTNGVLVGPSDSEKRGKALRECMKKLRASGINYIATPGRGTSPEDMDTIDECILKMSPRGNPKKLPGAIGLSEKKEAIDTRQLFLAGAGPAEIIIRLWSYLEIRKRSDKGDNSKIIKVAVFGAGVVASSILGAILHNYPGDYGVEIIAIQDDKNLIMGDNESGAIPMRIINEIVNRVSEGQKDPLAGLGNVFLKDGPSGITEINSPKPQNFGKAIESADIIVLAGSPQTFTEEHLKAARHLKTDLVILETNLGVPTQSAMDFINKGKNNHILYVPFSSANIGRIYAWRELLVQRLRGKGSSSTSRHIMDGITTLTMFNLWLEIEEWYEASKADPDITFKDVVRKSNERSFLKSNDLLFKIEEATDGLEKGSEVRRLKTGNKPIDNAFSIMAEYMDENVPREIALHIAVYDIVFSDAIEEIGIDRLKKMLKDGEEEERVIAAYGLGRIVDYDSEEQRDLTGLFGTALLNDLCPRVRRECAKALGRMHDPKAIDYIFKALSGERRAEALKRQVSIDVWEWDLWAWDNLRRRFPVEMKKYLERRNNATNLYISRVKKAIIRDVKKIIKLIKDETITARNLSLKGKPYQDTSLAVGKARTRRALVAQLSGLVNDKGVIGLYEKAVRGFKDAQAEGALLPIGIQFLLGRLYYNTKDFYNAKLAYFKLLVLSDVANLLKGKEAVDFDFNAALNLAEYFRINVLEALLKIDYEEEMARALARLLNKHIFNRKELMPPGPLREKDTPAERDAKYKVVADRYEQIVDEFERLVQPDIERLVTQIKHFQIEKLKELYILATEVYFYYPQESGNLIAGYSDNTPIIIQRGLKQKNGFLKEAETSL